MKKEEITKEESVNFEETQESIEEEMNDVSQENQEEISNEEEIKEDKSKDEECLSRLLRLQADFDNFKKRTSKEKDDIYKYALEGFVTKLLPVIDNLHRAIDSFDETEEINSNNSYVDGVKMVFSQLMDVLNSEGLKEVECLNEAFDPQFHHGVAVESCDDIEDNHIMEIYQKGYSFKEKVIRPAMVKICQK